MEINDIINSLNQISEKLFRSVEGQVFETLDHIVLIGPDILTSEPLKYIFQENSVNGMMIIAKALLLFYVVYYVFTQLLSLYHGNKAENIYYFIFKLVLIAILIQNSYFLCEQLLSLWQAFANAIDLFAKELVHSEVDFVHLKETIISMKDFMKNDLFSLDGLIKGIISFGAISILIAFSIRYVTVIFLLLISPLALVMLTSSLTKGICESWFKLLITNLSTGIVVKLIILIPLSYHDTNGVMYKIVLVGAIYLLYRLNGFMKDLLLKFTSDRPIQNIYRN